MAKVTEDDLRVAAEVVNKWKGISTRARGAMPRLDALDELFAAARAQQREKVWKGAIEIAKEQAESAAQNAWKIKDRYGDSDEEGLEMAACESARTIERELEAAAAGDKE